MKYFCTVLALCLLVCACSDDYDELIDEYNENFTVVEKDSQYLSVEDDDFDASAMLKEMYDVSNRSTTTLTIIAPQNGKSHSWLVSLAESGESVTLTGVDMASQTFSVYLPDSPLVAQTMYIIALSVTSSTGKVYSDTAKLWIDK